MNDDGDGVLKPRLTCKGEILVKPILILTVEMHVISIFIIVLG